MPIISKSPIVLSRDEGLTRSEGFISQNWWRGYGAASLTPTAQDVRGNLLALRKGDVITNLHYFVNTIGATPGNLTHGQLALFDSTGTRVGITADNATPFTTNSIKTIAMTATYTVKNDGVFYVANWFDQSAANGIGSTLRGFQPSIAFTPVGSGLPLGVLMTGQASMPSTLTLTAALQIGWAGVS